MPDDESNLVLRLLREMRTVLDQHSQQLEGIGRLEKQIETLHENTITALASPRTPMSGTTPLSGRSTI